jgi:hypothetical protein
MRTLTLKGIVGLAIVAATVAGRGPAALASGNVRVVSTATLSTYTAADPGTCDPNTFLPFSGDPACVATIFAEASDLFTDFQIWSGTIAGRGTGSFVIQEYDGVTKSDGSYTSKLRVVDGTGTGDFAGITGKGTSAGNLSGGTNTLKLKFPSQ